MKDVTRPLLPAAWISLCSIWAAMTMGCGASIQSVYEGDVRFERCMALDVQPQIGLHKRHACWSEWVSFYTYGQTRDRVLHAQLRIKQLNGGPVDHEDKLEGPRPTSALVPPPMLGPQLIEENPSMQQNGGE
jgi:hypothetical protein